MHSVCRMRPCMRRLTRSNGNWPVKYDRRRTAEGPVGTATVVINWVSVQRTGSESLNAHIPRYTKPPRRPDPYLGLGVLPWWLGQGWSRVTAERGGGYGTRGVGTSLRRRRCFENVTFAKSLPGGCAGCGEGRGSPWTYIIIYVPELLRYYHSHSQHYYRPSDQRKDTLLISDSHAFRNHFLSWRHSRKIV